MTETSVSVAGIALRDGKVLIARRKAGGDMGGLWEFPGGKVEEGESGPEAVVREYREEFDTEVSVGAFLGSIPFEHRGLLRRLDSYEIVLAGEPRGLHEHTEYRWASLEELESLDFVPSDRAAWGAAQTRGV
jgi:8-oxo-dGTP diphosphatase